MQLAIDPSFTPSAHPSAKAKLPPLLQDYLEYKRSYSDTVIFIQVGDFYEVFFDDAKLVARALNLTLTTRDKNSPQPVPMCGVPIHAIDVYLERLVGQGHSAALVSQTGVVGKGGFERKLDRIVTPAVRVLARESADRSQPMLAALVVWKGSQPVIVATEVETGVISIFDGFEPDSLRLELQRLAPAEIVIPTELDGETIDRRTAWVKAVQGVVSEGGLKFRRPLSDRDLNRDFNQIPGFSTLSAAGKFAVRQLVAYIDETTVGRLVSFSRIEAGSVGGTMQIDAVTRASLELVRTERGESVQGSLLGFLDRTRTPSGFRLLRRWVCSPSTELAEITNRHSAVELLLERRPECEQLGEQLRLIADVERIAARIELGVANPRELGALRDAYRTIPAISTILEQLIACDGNKAALFKELIPHLPRASELLGRLEGALVDAPPPIFSDGGIFKCGFSNELDRVREVNSEGRSWIAELEQKERERTGIGSLRIKYTDASGYFFEVTKANLGKVPSDFIRRQQTANGDRFVTERLRELDAEVRGANSKAVKLERELFELFRDGLKDFCGEMRAFSAALSKIDVLHALSDVASSHGYVRPVLDQSDGLELTQAVHPIIAERLGSAFVPNSLELGSGSSKIVLLTGPNMGGKTTFLRQAALCVIMAQVGSFVPAKAARIGIVDQIFARIGASDDQAEGDSTFMVEMREAAQIVRRATDRSLVLIDEIGRGTATADGYALAQAILEWLALQTRCRTIFATHFHELTEVGPKLDGVVNYSVGCEDREGEVVFTHHIAPGAARRSYGLEVAKLAGLPDQLLDRAIGIFRARELQPQPNDTWRPQLALFASADAHPRITQGQSSRAEIELQKLQAEIDAINVNELTPLEALNRLAKLKQLKK